MHNQAARTVPKNYLQPKSANLVANNPRHASKPRSATIPFPDWHIGPDSRHDLRESDLIPRAFYHPMTSDMQKAGCGVVFGSMTKASQPVKCLVPECALSELPPISIPPLGSSTVSGSVGLKHSPNTWAWLGLNSVWLSDVFIDQCWEAYLI